MRQAGVHSHKVNCMEVAAGIGLKRLKLRRESCVLLNVQMSRFLGPVTAVTLAINSPLRDLLVTFCHDLEKLLCIQNKGGFWHLNCDILGYCHSLSVPNLIILKIRNALIRNSQLFGLNDGILEYGGIPLC